MSSKRTDSICTGHTDILREYIHYPYFDVSYTTLQVLHESTHLCHGSIMGSMVQYLIL